MKQKKKKLSEKDMMLKAFRKANREIELERNGGHWFATTQTWKNKKAYNRKRDRKIDSDGLFNYNNLSSVINIKTDFKLQV